MSRKIRIAVTAAMIFSIVLVPFLSTGMYLAILPAHCTDPFVTCNGTILINATNIYLVNSTGTFPLGLNNNFISTSDNATYTFQNNINSKIGISNGDNASAIRIDKDNATLDGAGKKLNCSYNSNQLSLMGINITGRSNLRIKNLAVSNFTSTTGSAPIDVGGIVIIYSSRIFVYDCAFVNNQMGGIVIYYSNDTYIYRNHFIDHANGYGLDLCTGNNLQIACNSYESPPGGGGDGVLGYVSGAFFFGNNFTSVNLGITSSGGSSGNNNNVTRNNFTLGTVVLCGRVGGSKIYHNNLTSASAREMDLNYFDNGYPYGGNYWSSYNSTDDYKGEGQNMSGADHVIDYRYNITTDSTNCTDRYPFKFAYNLTSDVNLDNIVNMRDMYAIITASGTQPGDAKWNYFADASLDGFINSTDTQLVQAQFNQKMVLWP